VFLINQLFARFTAVELNSGVVDVKVSLGRDGPEVVYATGVVRALYGTGDAQSEILVRSGAFVRSVFPKPQEAVELFDLCDLRVNRFMLNRNEKIDWVYDHLASSSWYGDYWGELPSLRAELARRTLPPGHPDANLQRRCEGCRQEVCRLLNRRPGWADVHPVFTMTDEQVLQKNAQARAAGLVTCQALRHSCYRMLRWKYGVGRRVPIPACWMWRIRCSAAGGTIVGMSFPCA
jgi:hypothetical protein